MVKKLSLLLMAIFGLVALGIFFLFRRSATDSLPLWAVAFSPDSNSLVICGGGDARRTLPPRPGELLFWNISSGKKSVYHVSSSIRSVAWSSDGTFVATGDFGGVTKLVRPLTGRTIMNFSPPGDIVNAVAISSDSKLVASTTLRGVIEIWERSGKERQTLSVPTEQFLDVVFSPDADLVAATSRAGKAYLFDLLHGGEPKMLQAFSGPKGSDRTVECAAFSPDGQLLITGSQKTLRVWDTSTGKLDRDLVNSAAIDNVAYSPDGQTIATVDADGRLSLRDSHSGELANSTLAHSSKAYGLAFSPDGTRIATVGRFDFAVNVWNSQTLQHIGEWRLPIPAKRR